MRRLLISLAAAGTAIAVATPAAAQYYPQPAYGYGRGYGYDAGNAYELHARIDNLQRQIDVLARRGQLRGDSAGHLMEETRQLEWRLRNAARNGLNGWEARDVRERIGLIESRVQYAAANGYGYRNNGWNRGAYVDRDRDGRDDRYEDDGGWRRD